MEWPEAIAALAFFGCVVIVPVVYMLLRHQRAMAEILHRGGDHATQQRLERIELELRELRAAQHDLILRQDDARSVQQRLP